MLNKSAIIFILLLYAGSISAAGNIFKDYGYPHAQVVVLAGGAFSTGTHDFFDEYNNVIGGNQNSFTNPLLYGVGLKLQLDEGYRFSLTADMLGSNINEIFEETLIHNNIMVTRQFYENLDASTIPVILGIELLPIDGQFRTYAGFGAGVSISSIKWDENIYDYDKKNKELSGVKYSSNGILPTIRFYAGLELGFDKRGREGFISSLIVEPRFTYIFRNERILNNIKERFDDRDGWDKGFLISPAFVEIVVGLTFNFKEGAKK